MGKFEKLQKQLKEEKISIKVGTPKKISIENFKELNGYNPARNPQQLQAHNSIAPNILFAGDAGGGKSAWLINSLIHHCLKYQKSRVFLAREVFTSFLRTTYLEMLKWLPQNYIEEHNKKQQMVFFTNGSSLIYDGLHEPMQKLTSLEISAWGIDQAEFLDANTFYLLNSRLRLDVKNIQYQAFLTSNPCAGFLRDKFVKGNDPEFVYIPAIAEQNPFLPDGYLERLEKLPYEMRQILRNRDWDFIQSQNSFFEILEVDSAMKREKIEGGKSVGIDVGRGHDESCIAIKEGNHIKLGYCQITKDTMDNIQALENLGITKNIPIGIDVIGVGAGLADRLKELGYWVVEINGSERANDPRMFTTRKAEILWKLRQDLPALSLEKDKKLREQMRQIIYKVMNDNRISSETLIEIRKSGRESPDRLIAVSLANAVSEKIENEFETGKDRGGNYYIENGKKLYFRYFSSDLTNMVEKGQIGDCEIYYHPDTISEYDLQRLRHQGFIKSGWRERRKKWDELVEKYEKSGFKVKDLSFKFRY